MITRVEVKNYRCLYAVDQQLNGFNVVVGANASGKSTFFDALSLIKDILNDGLITALIKRTQSFNQITFNHSGEMIEVAVEAHIPEAKTVYLQKKGFDTIRYEVGISQNGGSVGFEYEQVWVINSSDRVVPPPKIQTLFPFMKSDPRDIALVKPGKRTPNYAARIVSRNTKGSTTFYPESSEKIAGEGSKDWFPGIKLNPLKSAFDNVPDDEERFPALLWFREYLMQGVQKLFLDSVRLRLSAPPYYQSGFAPDGSNLPWVVYRLSQRQQQYNQWIEHIRTALPNVKNVFSRESEVDKSRSLMVQYDNGLEVPSWLVSDGTLRLLALTIPAFLDDMQGMYLIEEPENGIHPKGIETIIQALSSLTTAQVLIATHSPIILNLVEPEQIYCFAKTEEGATDIVRGSEHPRLQEWRGTPSLGTLLAGGVLE